MTVLILMLSFQYSTIINHQIFSAQVNKFHDLHHYPIRRCLAHHYQIRRGLHFKDKIKRMSDSVLSCPLNMLLEKVEEERRQ